MIPSDSSPEVRVRFAPSPTGYLHIGGARTALFNWLFAKHAGGKFLLRIEDTDLERSTEESTQQILDSMAWLGLNHDEEIVYQTRRVAAHKKYIEQLLASGHAYKCYCTKERLDQLREQARAEGRTSVYDKCCLKDKDCVARNEAAGNPYVIRFNVPEEGVTVLDDMVYGRIEFENRQIGDFVIARPDGSPIYNFSNAVDDIDMRITHICRGEDHVSNTPRQILIYQALGKTPPQFAHLPLILGQDKTRLSKRHGATSVMQFKEQGILPQALINYVALLGWAPEGSGDFNEVMPLDDIIARFSLNKINKSAAVFDYEKLLWMNGMYIRNLSKSEVYATIIPYLEERFGKVSPENRNPFLNEEEWLHGVIDQGIERSRTINEFADMLDFYFVAPSSYDEKGMKKHLATEEQIQFLVDVGAEIDKSFAKVGEAPEGSLDAVEKSRSALEQDLRAWVEMRQVKFGAIAHPVRLALTGRTASPGLFDVIFFVGPKETARRIAAAVEHARALAA